MSSWLAALSSTICFAFMSLFVKQAIVLGIPSLDMVFYRFLFGSLFFLIVFIYYKRFPKIVSWKFSLLRAFTNIIAVSLFYITIGLIDLGSANLLNLTYPIFISLMAPFFLKEKSSYSQYLAVILSSVGIACLFWGNISLDYQKGIVFGLLCGFTSAITIMTLRQARKFDQSVSIVSILMFCGLICLLPFYSFDLPSTKAPYLPILLASIFAIAGQLFITYSFKKLSALQGSVISSSRILMSFLLGVVFLGDPFYLQFLLAFILVSLGIYLSKAKPNKKLTIKER